MTNAPLISVIIPAYRCGDTIGEAIKSALMQDVPLEVLVIDDCPDAPIDHAMEQFAQDVRVHFLKNKTNLGAAKTRNLGVSLAKGQYIAFLDADDLWKPGKLQKQIAILEETGCVLCCTARELLTPEGNSTGKVIPVKKVITYQELLKHNSINCSSVVMRRDVALEFPMCHEDSHEDYIMWLRVLQKYGSAQGINQPLLQYRLSSSGKSGSKLKSAKMTFMVYRYMGFGIIKSLMCFCSYAVHGVAKYLFTKKEAKQTT